MIYSTAQTAERLGVSPSVVSGMVKKGQLKSLAEKKNGATKVFHKFDSVEINEFKKTHKRVGKKWYLNEEAPAQPRAAKTVEVPVSGGGGVLTRLDNIERMVEQLLKIWS